MTADELLNQVLGVFNYYKDNIKILDYLSKREMIHHSFEKRYLLNNVAYQFTIIDRIDNNDLIEFFWEAMDGSPFKAEVIFDGKWYLKSFLFQCQSCFGEIEDCNVCGGSGWGVL